MNCEKYLIEAGVPPELHAEAIASLENQQRAGKRTHHGECDMAHMELAAMEGKLSNLL